MDILTVGLMDIWTIGQMDRWTYRFAELTQRLSWREKNLTSFSEEYKSAERSDMDGQTNIKTDILTD